MVRIRARSGGGTFFLALAAPILLSVGCRPAPICDLAPCDIRKLDCQQRAARSAACLLDQPPANIPVTTLTRSQLLAESLAETTAIDVARERQRLAALGLLNLVSPDVQPETATTLRSRWVGAYYDRATKAVTIIVEDNDQKSLDGVGAMTLLMHEYTHALQDIAGHLAFPGADGDDSFDRYLARGAMVEGEASLSQARAMLSLFGHDDAKVPWPRVFSHVQSEATDQAIDSPVPLDLAYPHFVYPFGLAIAQRAFATTGGPGVRALWEMPPVTSRQVMHPPGTPLPDPTPQNLGDDAVPVVPSNFTFLEGDRYGSFLFEVFLRRLHRQWPSLTPAFEPHWIPIAAANLRADYLSLFAIGGGALGAFASWRLRFAEPAMAAEVAQYLSRQGDPRWSILTMGSDVAVIARSHFHARLAVTTWQAAPASIPLPAPLPRANRVLCPRSDLRWLVP